MNIQKLLARKLKLFVVKNFPGLKFDTVLCFCQYVGKWEYSFEVSDLSLIILVSDSDVGFCFTPVVFTWTLLSFLQ